ncbi:MAG TPA: TonB-dependent receptor [Bryobacteraceae bacterium]|nr:TonB-dependent receptor [Bryobacteraceae bacterium]
MSPFKTLALLCLCASVTLAQSDRGTITGTVSDPAGALVPGVSITAENPETGVQFRTETTSTGNYTIPSVPAGVYNMTVEHTGFRKYIQTGITVQVAQSARIDIVLQIGSTAEVVNVSADAPLLKTESAEQSTTISGETINQLPINFAIGAGAVRNPLSFVQLSPGASIGGWNDIRVNGAPGNTFRIIFEGQDTTSALNPRVSDESQPSVEAIQEFTLQTSNFSAEFGQVSGGLFNFTSRSGTNQFHGSAYEYFAHEKLGAGQPFGNYDRPKQRRHNFGGSVGGPVILPKLYNGRDRTFFFANFEMFRDRATQNLGDGTVPTEAFRNGDFSAALTGRTLGTDPLGRPIIEGTIYDPATTREVNGQVVRDPFPGNRIPTSRLDPVALKVQSLIPSPTRAGLVNNFVRTAPYRKIQDIPSVKIDHSFTTSSKMSFYWSRMRTDKDNGLDGLPDPISRRRDQIIRSQTVRVNYDHSLTPTTLLHLGAGYQRYRNPDSAPENILDYDATSQLGLTGLFGSGFPRIRELSNAFGGLNVGGSDIGPTNRNLYTQDKPTAVASVTSVRGNHTYKAGGEWRVDTFTNANTNGVAGDFQFSGDQTTLPSTQGQNLQGGVLGHNYASFLLGLAQSGSIANPQDPQYRRTAWGFFVQDTWKVSRRLTLDLGIRYDLQPAAVELHRRTSMFAPTVPNPNAGGLPGATIYAGSGPGRCDCDFADTYPYGIAPRLGAAYHINDKTVLRAGWGISYGQLTGFNYIGGGNSQGMGFNSIPFNSPAFGEPGIVLQQGLRYDPAALLAASYDPGLLVTPGRIVNATAHIDRNGGRPPRVNQWNVSLQRELTNNLVVEAAYVGNRGAWFRGDGLLNYNAISEDRLQSFGLSLNNPADLQLLASRLDSPLAASRGFNRPPYRGFPVTSTVAQALRPFPQFGTVGSLWAPLGNSWYDSLQMKLTKRYSYGLDFSVAYTWSKTLTTTEDQDGSVVPTNNVFNREIQKTLSRSDQPHVLVVAYNYQVPTFTSNRFVRHVVGGWTLGGIMRYASGTPIRVPVAQNRMNDYVFQSTFANRVPGEPLFLKDPNCHCYDPNAEFILNRNAWSDPAPGQWGTAAAYYSDYRTQRRYSEQMSLGKSFRMNERGMFFSIRAEFFNIFNRRYFSDPESGNALATQRSENGVPIAGFGRINPAGFPGDFRPRSGQIVARFQF